MQIVGGKFTRATAVRFTEKSWGLLEIFAKENNESVNNVIRKAVDEFLSKNKISTLKVCEDKGYLDEYYGSLLEKEGKRWTADI